MGETKAQKSKPKDRKKKSFKLSGPASSVSSPNANPSSHQFPAFIPKSYLFDAKLRINAYRELAEANTEKSIVFLETR